MAAGIFLAALATLLPAVQNSRSSWLNAACTANLQKLGVGLNHYATIHNSYPYTSDDCKAPYSGAYVLMLHDEGLLDDLRLLDCPSNGRRSCRRLCPTANRSASTTPSR